MPEGLLVDAGPLVAILSRRDRHHRTCIKVLKKIRGPLLSTWMPVTEAMYLLDFSIAAQGALLEMIERGTLHILELVRGDLSAMHMLMRKYHNQPMDFADASLVQVADRLGLNEIFTLDRRDFSVYRLGKNRAFRILPP
ncbi:MAG TPA: PIN domain-containing protein [Woeseiaceae bacterium]|nr:PIN domain-containing protein [Woeseiaceae bacterium]